tara:strand:- start:39710 stop:39910 length:201 start_codon:yes stop_codon:yes gene_type:complete
MRRAGMKKHEQVKLDRSVHEKLKDALATASGFVTEGMAKQFVRDDSSAGSDVDIEDILRMMRRDEL